MMAENSDLPYYPHLEPMDELHQGQSGMRRLLRRSADGQRLHKVQWGNRARQRTGAHTWNDPLRTKTATHRRAGKPGSKSAELRRWSRCTTISTALCRANFSDFVYVSLLFAVGLFQAVNLR
jgi:hypothetical protein